MNKKFIILLILLLLLAVGYTMYVQEKQTDNEEVSLQEKQTDNEDWGWEEFFAEMEREEEERLKPICEQEMIPAMYASDCYFRELKDCDSMSGKMIPKSELEKCLPVFLKEEIENMIF